MFAAGPLACSAPITQAFREFLQETRLTLRAYQMGGDSASNPANIDEA